MLNKISVLLYNDYGYSLGLEKYKNLKNPSRFWLQFTDVDNFTEPLHELEEAVEEMCIAVSSGKPYENKEGYEWAFNTPTLLGTYSFIVPEAQNGLAKLESETLNMCSVVAAKYGLRVIKEEKNLQRHFQQITIGK